MPDVDGDDGAAKALPFYTMETQTTTQVLNRNFVISTLVCNFEIGTQFLDSENAQHNLTNSQIVRHINTDMICQFFKWNYSGTPTPQN